MIPDALAAALQATGVTLPTLLEEGVALLQVLVWPLLLLYVLRTYREEIGELLGNLRYVSVGGTTLEFREAVEAAAETAARLGVVQGGKASGGAGIGEIDEREAHEIALVVGDAVLSGWPRRGRRLSLLWVDDEPGNIELERAAFEELGLNVAHVATETEAIDRLGRPGADIDVVVSDMNRGGDEEAGYGLAERVHEEFGLPVVLYTHRDVDEGRPGLVGVARSPRQLFELVRKA